MLRCSFCNAVHYFGDALGNSCRQLVPRFHRNHPLHKRLTLAKGSQQLIVDGINLLAQGFKVQRLCSGHERAIAFATCAFNCGMESFVPN